MPQARRTHSRDAHTALLIVDMISEFAFPGGEALVGPAVRAAKRIAELKRRAQRMRTPIIYVNDTAGEWESDQRDFVRRCARPGARGRKIVELIAPTETDYFIFKLRHSGFFNTPLNSLLSKLRVQRLVLTGISAHQCVMFTAIDAHMRGYALTIPRKGVASPTPGQTRRALTLMAEALEAQIR